MLLEYKFEIDVLNNLSEKSSHKECLIEELVNERDDSKKNVYTF